MGYAKRAWEWLFKIWDKRNCLFGKITITTFVVAQCLDGIFTYVGVRAWGLGMEVNPLLVWFMSVIGVGIGLIAVKIVAVVLGTIIYRSGRHNIVAVLATIYLVVAVLPWAYLFLTF